MRNLILGIALLGFQWGFAQNVTLGILKGPVELNSLNKSIGSKVNWDSLFFQTLLHQLDVKYQTGMVITSNDAVLPGTLVMGKRADVPQPAPWLPHELKALQKTQKHKSFKSKSEVLTWMGRQHGMTVVVNKVYITRPFWTRIFEPKRRVMMVSFDIYNSEGKIIRGGTIIKGFRVMKKMNASAMMYIAGLVAHDLATEVNIWVR